MVLDKTSKMAATEFANRVANAMREEGVLLNKLGIYYNTLKIRPPMCFSQAHADLLLQTSDRVLEKNTFTPVMLDLAAAASRYWGLGSASITLVAQREKYHFQDKH